MGGRGAHAYDHNNQVAWEDYLYAQEIQTVQKDYETFRTLLKSENSGGNVSLKKRCACCGQLSLPANTFYEQCVVCGWVDDPNQNKNKDSTAGENPICLANARQIWKEKSHRKKQ